MDNKNNKLCFVDGKLNCTAKTRSNEHNSYRDMIKGDNEVNSNYTAIRGNILAGGSFVWE